MKCGERDIDIECPCGRRLCAPCRPPQPGLSPEGCVECDTCGSAYEISYEGPQEGGIVATCIKEGDMG